MRAILVGVCALLLAACNPVAVMDDTAASIEQFHSHWNAGNTDAIWDATHSEFRRGPSKDEFSAAMAGFAETLGDVESSQRGGFNINTANGVTTTVITMNTRFTNGEGVEQFTYRTQGDAQRLIYYYVESDLLNDVKPGDVEGADYYPLEKSAAESDKEPAS